MKLKWLTLAFCLAPFHQITSAATLTTLHSFGVSGGSGAMPAGELLEGSDGFLYGTTAAGGSSGLGTLFRLNKDGSDYRILSHFGSPTNSGAMPLSGLVEASDGSLYGTSEVGGQFGFGTVFRLSKNGTLVLLKSFGGEDGGYPDARLLEASDGFLYGTTSGGGTNDFGTIFRLAKDGSDYSVVMKFGGTNGANPAGRLLECADGLLYGTTAAGGSNNCGTVFRLGKDGDGYEVLKYFSSLQSGGYLSAGGLVEGTNGMLYGTTSAGGTNASGVLYRLSKDGSSYSVVRNFVANTGRVPQSELIQGADTRFYGTTSDGGSSNFGVVFAINQDGSGYTVLTNLGLSQAPAAGLIEGSDGALYGVSQLGGDSGDGTVFKIQKNGTGFAVVLNFSSSGGDGQGSSGTLSLGSCGALHGTTRLGGRVGAGSVFAIRFDGRGYRQVSSLDPSLGLNTPLAGVLPGADGTLFGASPYGGSAGLGALFSVHPDGSGLTSLYSLPTSGYGQEPRAALSQASNGALYGTTFYGGGSGAGSLFRVNVDGSGYTVLKSFITYYTGGATSPGANPAAPLLETAAHQLFGTAYSGGASNNGTIFRLNLDGGDFTVVKSFGNPLTDGANPLSPLLAASDGALYGTTYGGGTTNNGGAVYRINPDGSGFQVLHAFVGLGGDARHPCGNLVEGADGALYGTTERGGSTDRGALFTLRKDGGGYAMLASFGASVGAYPRGGLVLGPDGALYGTAPSDGEMAAGTVFRYGAPIEELMELRLEAGKVVLTFLGLPDTSYSLERRAGLLPGAEWTTVCTTNSLANNSGVLVDPNPLPTAAFYRLKR